MKKITTLCLALFAMASITTAEVSTLVKFTFDDASLSPTEKHADLTVSDITKRGDLGTDKLSFEAVTYGKTHTDGKGVELTDDQRPCLLLQSALDKSVDKKNHVCFNIIVPEGKQVTFAETSITYQKINKDAKNTHWRLYRVDEATDTLQAPLVELVYKSGTKATPYTLANQKPVLNIWIPSTFAARDTAATAGLVAIPAGKYTVMMAMNFHTAPAGAIGSLWIDEISMTGTITDAPSTSITTTENDGLIVRTADHLLNVILKEAADVTVYTMTGNAIARQVGATQAEFSLPQGVYMVRAISGTNSMVRKVIVR